MNKILKNCIYGLLLLTPLTALFVVDSMFFPFITGKAFYFRLIVEIAFFLYLALAILEPSYRPKRSILLWCASLFTLAVFIADIFAPNPSRAIWSNFERMEGFVTIAHVFAYFLVLASVFRHKKDWNNFLFVSLGVAGFLSLYGVLQLSGELIINQGGVRVDATLGNSAYFAGYLLFNIFITAILWRINWGKIKGIAETFSASLFAFVFYYIIHISDPNFSAHRFGIIFSIICFILAIGILLVRFLSENYSLKLQASHVIYGGLILLQMVLLYYTATRGAILGFIGGVLLTALILLIRHRENKKVRIISFSIIALIIVLVSGFFSIRKTSFVQNSPVLNRFANISWGETKTQARSYIWPMAIEGFKEKPILGWGQEGFIYLFQEHYNPLMWGHEPWFDRTHNVFLDWLVAGGILAFLGYVSLYISSLYILFKKTSLDHIEKALVAGLFAGYAFNNLFIFDNIASYILFFGFLAYIYSSSITDAEINTEVLNKKKSVDDDELNPYLIFSICIVALGFTLYFVNGKPYFQNITLTEAISIAGVKNGAPISCLKSEFQQQMAGEKPKNVCIEYSPTIDLFKKTFSYNSLGNSEARQQMMNIFSGMITNAKIDQKVKVDFANETFNELQKETKEASRDVRSYLFAGTFLSGVGEFDQAISYLEKARELAPKKQQVLLQLALAYLQKGDKEKAYEVAKETYNLAQDYPEASAIFSVIALYDKKNDEADVAIDKLASKGIVDQRVVLVLFEQKMQAKAIEELKKAIVADKTNETNYTLLFDAYVSSNNKSLAPAVMDLMLQNNPGNKEMEAKAKEYLNTLNATTTVK